MDSPLILYSPLSWLRELRTLRAEEALEPTVSTRSKPGWATSVCEASGPGRAFSSAGMARPGRRAKGFRIGIVAVFGEFVKAYYMTARRMRRDLSIAVGSGMVLVYLGGDDVGCLMK